MANTDYCVIIGDSRRMQELSDSSVHLVVTSPPYPMVGIWDDFFREEAAESYDAMHIYLNQTWKEVKRVLVPGGIACINIGDATRTKDGMFHLYPNHSRVIETFERLGLVTLPYVLWKKPTTKPRYKGKGAFLGSGFLPPNAYVTLDMEYILIFRNGGLRTFEPKDPKRDPFLGSGTTLKTAMDLGRRFTGYERLEDFSGIIRERMGRDSEKIVFQKQSVGKQFSELTA